MPAILRFLPSAEPAVVDELKQNIRYQPYCRSIDQELTTEGLQNTLLNNSTATLSKWMNSTISADPSKAHRPEFPPVFPYASLLSPFPSRANPAHSPLSFPSTPPPPPPFPSIHSSPSLRSSSSLHYLLTS
ncbi:hypothetical protein GQ43DRAFT_199960 [Delitschia confertaspora ATCC 74209]|uniref:Uncharacterized protein n=1 Tax=Delitschia confertaspora ATCC 74209 TaxID=1513339 RepID=A0A9P4MLW4_9PLEO|nr:hypothetical protein GQ43DRAFT_199960 [Delitschia confertaspora ATCC 74209]